MVKSFFRIMQKAGNRDKNILLLTMMISVTASCSVWNDRINIFSYGSKEGNNSTTLTTGEVIRGLKETLTRGTGYAVNTLGRTDGFFLNPAVKIQLPDALEKVEDTLRALHQDKVIDEFILTMNRAAEQAVPATARVFTDAIDAMTFTDARAILQGPDDAATDYFKNSSVEKLAEKILPIVKVTTDAAGVTAKYKKMMDKLDAISGLNKKKSINLDRYITEKTLDGLFKMLAAEERRIRHDPAARTTETLKKVFGY